MPTHRAPRSHLPGDAAGGRPGWAGRITDRVFDDQRRKAARRGTLQNWPSRVTIACAPELSVMLVEAARGRGMSISGYARRALCAFLAHDLGLPFEEVCQHTPKPAPAGQVAWGRLPGTAHPSRHRGRWADDGQGYGSWKVAS